MEATELMIGDWVSYRGVFNQIAPADFDPDHKMWMEEIKPISLTPEILEKNGFVKNRGVTSWKFETDREDLIDIYGVKEYHLSINIEDTHGSGKGYRWLLNNLTIFYVHQLQHALRLCGIKKEIKL